MNRYRNAVRSIVIAGLVVLGLGAVKRAEAGPGVEPDTMLVSVTPHNFTYAVVISSPLTSGATGYDFGQVDLGASTLSTLAIVVKSSGTIAEFFSLAISNSLQDGWTPVGSNPTLGHFTMLAYFTGNGGMPAESTVSGSGTALTTSVPVSGSGLYGQGSTKTAPGSSDNLWLRLTMPDQVANQNPQTMVLTVNGTN